MQEKHYDVVIVGAGISGTAALYTICKYSDISNVAILEKYASIASLNTGAHANSQTIHAGDIETNYNIEKALKVKTRADMIVKYIQKHGCEDKFAFKGQKIVMGVGEEEVEIIKKRFDEFKEFYPNLELFSKQDLKELEPQVVFDKYGNERIENVAALGNKECFTTVNYAAMAQSLIENSKNTDNKNCDVYLNTKVENINKVGDKFYIQTSNNLSITADFVLVNAGAHSLYLALNMGLGENLGCIPVAGSFYMSRKHILKGKVYMIQDPKLPFSAMHGDPDILTDGCTRFGPTALPLLKLERFHGFSSFFDYLKCLNLDKEAFKFLYSTLSDMDFTKFLAKNVCFEIPILNRKLFIKDARKIVPGLDENDIKYAKGFGGVRPQIFDKTTQEMLFGEASINENGIIFNMTPSPGATSSLWNAWNNTKDICKYLNKSVKEEEFVKDYF